MGSHYSHSKRDDSPPRGRGPDGGQFPALFLQVTASFSDFSSTTPSSAASFETLQCEGPVNTPDSSCHPHEHLMDAREVDFQVKGYTFSKPFHLIVSYGEVLGRTDRCRPVLAPISQTSPLNATVHSERCPRKLAME